MEEDSDSSIESTGTLSSLKDNPRRAAELKERVLEIDPNHGRCIVENCDTSRAIEYCHIFSRSYWDHSSLVRGFYILAGMRLMMHHSQLSSLEWFWKMRARTLNLDTCRNVVPSEFCFALMVLHYNSKQTVGSSVHHMYNAGLWALLPDDAIVQQYSQCLAKDFPIAFTSREDFPVIEVAIHVAIIAIAAA